MARTLESILPDFKPSKLQQAAIERIQHFQKTLENKYGMHVRSAIELEFTVKDHDGHLTPAVINMNAARRFFTRTEALPLIEEVKRGDFNEDAQKNEYTTQYEITIADTDERTKQPVNVAAFSPAGVAGVTARLKQESLKKLLQTSTCLESEVRSGGKSYSPVFAARPGPGTGAFAKDFERITSALHINVSLYDKNGNNLFAESRPLLRHCMDSLADIQDKAGLAMLPNENSLQRIGANSITPAGIGQQPSDPSYWEKGPNRYTSINERGYHVEFGGPDKEGTFKHVARIENRLPGADADPFVAMAVTMGALVEAVEAHVHKSRIRTPGGKLPLPHDAKLFLDPAPASAPQYEIPKEHGELVARFKASSDMKKLLGAKLFNAIAEEYGQSAAR